MKGILSFMLVACFFTSSAQKADRIVGKWMKVPKEDMIIQVYKSGNEYKGKIAWTKTKDPDKKVGSIILDKLKYNPDSEVWEDGKIHDPRNGKTYTASVKIKPDGMLEMTGYLGFKFFGKKKEFRRLSDNAAK